MLIATIASDITTSTKVTPAQLRFGEPNKPKVIEFRVVPGFNEALLCCMLCDLNSISRL